MIRFWDFRNTKLVAEMQVPSPVIRFCMSGNNSLLALGVGNGSIGVVDTLCRKLVRIINGAHRSVFTALGFSPDGKWLVSADDEGFIKVRFFFLIFPFLYFILKTWNIFHFIKA